MKRSLVVGDGRLKKWTDNPELENIIIGTGALAWDMREKLLLLGLKVPFLVGEKHDEENNILHYSKIAELGDPKRYRFIVCCDDGEGALFELAQPAAYRFLGSASSSHPRMITLNNYSFLRESAGKELHDAVNGTVVLRDSCPYAVYGDEHDDTSFHIHILGSCHAGGIVKYSRQTYPELLYQKLSHAGFNAAVYTWGQPRNPDSDNIVRYIRDVCFHKADLIILYHTNILTPLSVVKRNILSTRADTPLLKHPFITQLDNTYNAEVSDGIDHDISLIDIVDIQQRIFIAFSRLFGFTFWHIVPPAANDLPEEQARTFHPLSLGYYSRRRKRKDEILNALDRRYVKDYTDTFASEEDIFSMFADYGHLSSEGNRLVAERCATDILEAFGNRR